MSDRVIAKWAENYFNYTKVDRYLLYFAEF